MLAGVPYTCMVNLEATRVFRLSQSVYIHVMGKFHRLRIKQVYLFLNIHIKSQRNHTAYMYYKDDLSCISGLTDLNN